MDRIDLRNLVEIRLKDARVLMDHGQYDGAYYLAGYAVECALKSVIAGFTREHEFPDLGAVRKAYTHDFRELVVAAGLSEEIDKERTRNAQFSKYWKSVLEWKETSRYEGGRLSHEVEEILRAVTDPKDGVLAWISKHW